MHSRITAALLLLSIHFSLNHFGADPPSLPPPAKDRAQIKFKHPSFSFARVKYSSGGRRASSWHVDFPDAEINFTRRFHEATGLPVQKEKVVELRDDSLKGLPFIYMAEGGDLWLSDDEAKALRTYLLSGGFLMIDDFWGEREWTSLAEQMKRVFPELTPIDLPLDHSIFHCFYDLKEKPQVPNMSLAIRYKDTGITWERYDAKQVHYRAFIDPNGRLMAVLCHNTDLADGWERENEDPWYTSEFSMKKAYPMGLNIAVYALTH